MLSSSYRSLFIKYYHDRTISTLFSPIVCVHTFLVCFAQENGFVWLIFSYFHMEKERKYQFSSLSMPRLHRFMSLKFNVRVWSISWAHNTVLCGCSFLVCPCRQTQQQLFSSFRASVNHIPPVPINYCLHPKHLPKRYPLKKYSLGVAQVSCWNTGERVGKAVLSLKNPIQNLSYLLDNAQLNFPLLENVGFYYFKQTEDLHTKQELSKCMQKKLKLPCFWQLFKKVKKKRLC